jgi:hypothetical protein
MCSGDIIHALRYSTTSVGKLVDFRLPLLPLSLELELLRERGGEESIDDDIVRHTISWVLSVLRQDRIQFPPQDVQKELMFFPLAA